MFILLSFLQVAGHTNYTGDVVVYPSHSENPALVSTAKNAFRLGIDEQNARHAASAAKPRLYVLWKADVANRGGAVRYEGVHPTFPHPGKQSMQGRVQKNVRAFIFIYSLYIQADSNNPPPPYPLKKASKQCREKQGLPPNHTQTNPSEPPWNDNKKLVLHRSSNRLRNQLVFRHFLSLLARFPTPC